MICAPAAEVTADIIDLPSTQASKSVVLPLLFFCCPELCAEPCHRAPRGVCSNVTGRQLCLCKLQRELNQSLC